MGESLYYLAAQNDNDEIKEKLFELEQTMSQLILDLDQVFKVIYNDVGYMYEVVDITGNSTEVVENLQALNGTVAGYIEHMLVRADNVERASLFRNSLLWAYYV